MQTAYSCCGHADRSDLFFRLAQIAIPFAAPKPDERLENWAIVRLWFAGQFFDSAKDLLHAWQHDVKGLQSKFKFDMPSKWS